MFNNKLKKLFVILFLVTSITLVFGCSSKPSEETIKGIIKQRLVPTDKTDSCYMRNFKITKTFNKKSNEENFYCVEVSFELLRKQKPADIVFWNVNKAPWRFIKRGKKWQGQPGWPT
jgi:hypothetical protein